MNREILINQDCNEIQAAIVEAGRLEEFYLERLDACRMFGNIYKGRVKTVIRGMGAAFVHLGSPKDGFLYVADALRSPIDLEAEPDPDTAETPGFSRDARRAMRHKRIDEVLKIGQEVIVQVVKEPMGTKGPRLTTHFSIPARYLVMIPGDEKIGISGRIADKKERDRIRSLFKSLEIPKGVGFIVRTAAEGKSETEFTRDIRYLIKAWKRIHRSIAVKKAPSMIHQELGLVERIIRDHLMEDSDKIVVSNKELLQKVKRFLGLYLPGSKLYVELFQGHSMFEHYNIAKEIERTYQKNVYLKSGGYIVIQQTEGLVAIDVNTGKFTGAKDLEETVFKTNLEAAEEVARQMRLRDMGGIIVIDFIDLERGDHRRELFRVFNAVVSRDRAKTNILPISELGLVEMTRQRIRPSHESSAFDNCPHCEGKGVVKSVTTMAIETMRELRKAIGDSKGRMVHVYVHPDVSTRILENERRTIQNFERASQSKIFIFGEASLHIEDVNLTFVK